MAKITFDGPAMDGTRTITEVSMDDAAFLAVVEAVCASEGYTGDHPGLFVINKTIAGWQHATELYQKNKAQQEANAKVDAALAPLKGSIVICVDGVKIADAVSVSE